MLYEEAFSIYVKFFKPEHTTDKKEQVDMPALAIGLLADCQKALDHAKGVLLDATKSPYGQNWVKCSRKRRCQSMPQCLSFMQKIPQNSEYHTLCTEARTLLLFFLKCSLLLWGVLIKTMYMVFALALQEYDIWLSFLTQPRLSLQGMFSSYHFTCSSLARGC
jgi:hypothetical protein